MDLIFCDLVVRVLLNVRHWRHEKRHFRFLNANANNVETTTLKFLTLDYIEFLKNNFNFMDVK